MYTKHERSPQPYPPPVHNVRRIVHGMAEFKTYPQKALPHAKKARTQ